MMNRTISLVITAILLTSASSIFADFQIDSFDDIFNSDPNWTTFPEGGIFQGDDANSIEGTGSMVVDFTPYDANEATFYINKTVSMDLSPSAIGAADAGISLWMYIGATSVTGRLSTIQFETEYLSYYEYAVQPWNKTWDVGWHELFIPQSDFTVRNDGTNPADWADITKITIVATAYGNDGSTTDVNFDDLRLVEYTPPAPDVIDSFDDISGWNVHPSSAGGIIQGDTGDCIEGTGCMIVDYTPYPGFDNYNLSKTVLKDLSPSTIGVTDAAVSLWMWIGKDTVTARLDSLVFETSYGNDFTFDPQPWNYTLPVGWHEFVISQDHFVARGSADWSDITSIKINTSCYNDGSPLDVKFDDMRLVEYMAPDPSQIESFDDISSMNLSIWPDAGWIVQAVRADDDANGIEGTGSLKVEYSNYDLDPNSPDYNPGSLNDEYFNWYLPVPRDLSASVIGASEAAISFWMWVGKDTQTARVVDIKFATDYYSSEFEYVLDPPAPQDPNETAPPATYDVGWNRIVIPQSDFVNSSSTTTDPDWAVIEWIAIHTACSPDEDPNDLLIDDLRIVELKCNIEDLDGDCLVDLYDFSVLGGGWQTTYDIADLSSLASCWLVDCIFDYDSPCCQ